MATRASSFAIRHFFQAKLGNADAEYEDAFWPRRWPELSSEPVRLAVADGATEASFSREWARLLVRAYGSHGAEVLLIDGSLERLRQRWLGLVNRRELPWFADEKRRMGAFAAIAGLTLRAAGENRPGGLWEAVAVGDCCIFHIRGRKLLSSFPLTRSDQFTTRPRLLSSLRDAESVEPARAEGTWERGDAFHLVSDALACWCLAEFERGETPLSVLQTDRNNFSATVESARSAINGPRMRNDDVTCVSCFINAPESEGA